MPGFPRSLCALAVALLLAGCSSSKSSNTARTATEQLLISNAVDQALDKVEFSRFSGLNVFFDEKHFDGVDKSYVVGSIRHRILYSGGRLVPKAEEADVIIEARSGGLGTDTTETFYGLPEVVVPGMVTIPELKVAQRMVQRGSAKIGFVAYDAKSKQIIGQGGLTMAVSNNNDWSVLGVGPFKNGTLKQEIKAGTSGDSYNPQFGLPRTVAFDDSRNLRRDDSAGAIRLTGHADSSPVR